MEPDKATVVSGLPRGPSFVPSYCSCCQLMTKPNMQCTQLGDVVNALKKKLLLKRVFTNSVDPDKTPHNAASHQGLHYLLC